MLPGEEIVQKGIRDLEQGIESPEALLASMGAVRLRQAGVAIPNQLADPEGRLYHLLSREDPDSAHGRYNALVRRLVAYERAAEALGAPAHA